MSLFEIFGTYLVLNLILFLALTVYVIAFRFSNNVSLGDAGSPILNQRIRAHGNFVENAPLHLLALISMMQLGTSTLMMHVIGAMFLAGRVLHAFGITRANSVNRPRQIGTVLTLLSFLVAVIYITYLLIVSRGSYGIS